MTKSLVLKYAIYGAGIIAACAFVVSRNEDLLDMATKSAYRHGDLYRLALVRDFKMEIPPQSPSEGKSTEDWDEQPVIFIGDSFSETCRGHLRLPESIARALNCPVYYVLGNDNPEYFNPCYLLKEKHIRKGPRRLLILERVERYISSAYGSELDTDPVLPDSAAGNAGVGASLVNILFGRSEQNYQFLLQSSALTVPVVELWNTALFHTIHRISSETPVYSLNPPFLFYFDETCADSASSFYAPHPDSLVETIAGNISALREVLISQYNTDLVFIPVPAKYTLYHGLVNNDQYDGYLPRLSAALTRRRVPNVNLYDAFMASRDTLYFPTDTHWNAKGAQLALQQTLKVLKTRSLEVQAE